MGVSEVAQETKKLLASNGSLRKKRIPGAKSIRYKACLVAKGYSQTEGADFNKVFSPIVKHTSIRVL